jgi:hypothetical protein
MLQSFVIRPTPEGVLTGPVPVADRLLVEAGLGAAMAHQRRAGRRLLGKLLF